MSVFFRGEPGDLHRRQRHRVLDVVAVEPRELGRLLGEDGEVLRVLVDGPGGDPVGRDRLVRPGGALDLLRRAALGVHLVVLEQAVRPGLVEPLEHLAQRGLGVGDEVLVADHQQPVAELDAALHLLGCRVDPVVDGPDPVQPEPLGHRRGDRAGLAHHRDEHGVREDAGELAQVPGVPRRLVTPALLAVTGGEPLEHPGVELAHPLVELVVGPAEPAVPVATVAVERDPLVRQVGPHDAGLLGDRDVVVAVHDQPHQRRPRTHRSDDEDGLPAAHDVGAVVWHAVSLVVQQAGAVEAAPRYAAARGARQPRQMSSGTVSPVLLSVVLVVRRHQAWVRPCLRSILDQAPADLDVVVVDDASPDHSARIIAEAVAGDARVRTHRSDQPVGTAESIRTGLELARGDYVWLVEAADLLLPGAFATVTAGLSSAPDVLLVGEVERDVYGKDRRPDASPRGRPVMRNRIVRREHLLGIDVLPDAHLDEIGLASAVLAAAATVEQVDTPVYAHRVLPARVVRQWTTATRGMPLLRSRARGRRGAPRRPPPGGSRDACHAAGPPCARQSVRPATQPSVAARSTRTSRCSRRTGARPTRATRAPSTRRPASWRRGSAASGWSSAGPRTSCPPAWSYVVEGSREYYRLMARATYFVNNVNFPNDIVKRRGQIHLQTHHGTPLKTMGMDLVNAKHSSLGLNFRRLMTRVAAVGLQHLGQRVHHRDLGAGLPERHLREPRDRLPAQRRPRHRRPPSTGTGCAPSWASRPARRRCSTHRRTASTPRSTCRCVDLDELVAALARARRRADARALLLRRRRRVRAPDRG